MKKTKQSYPLSRLLVFLFFWFDHTFHLLLYVCKCNDSGRNIYSILEDASFENIWGEGAYNVSQPSSKLVSPHLRHWMSSNFASRWRTLNWHFYWIDIWIFLFDISIWIDISTSVQLISVSTISPSTIATNSFKSHV